MGALIHPQVVLTCAHNLGYPNVYVRAGVLTMKSSSSNERGVMRFIKHPNSTWTSSGDANNLALLVLYSPFELNSNLNTVSTRHFMGKSNGIDILIFKDLFARFR
jgi:hypothetical protein